MTSYVIESIERLNNSRNGNPRYKFLLSDTETGHTQFALLSSDASVGYAIGNPGYRVGSTVTIGWTRAGRVATMTTIAEREQTYKIKRFRQHGPSEVIATGLTLEEAQAHCNDPSTSGDGWFDGYEAE